MQPIRRSSLRFWLVSIKAEGFQYFVGGEGREASSPSSDSEIVGREARQTLPPL